MDKPKSGADLPAGMLTTITSSLELLQTVREDRDALAAIVELIRPVAVELARGRPDLSRLVSELEAVAQWFWANEGDRRRVDAQISRVRSELEGWKRRLEFDLTLER